MDQQRLEAIIEGIVSQDSRYDVGAYYFLQEALEASLKRRQLEKHVAPSEHIGGPELLDGIRLFALEQFGPMTMTVFNEWGVKRCEDFGEIVYNLIEAGVLGKSEGEGKADFAATYHFKVAFENPFLPKKAR